MTTTRESERPLDVTPAGLSGSVGAAPSLLAGDDLVAMHGVEIVHPRPLLDVAPWLDGGEKDPAALDLGPFVGRDNPGFTRGPGTMIDASARWAQHKLNGVRLIVSKDNDGVGLATTRTGDTGDLWWLALALPCMAWMDDMPDGTVVDGELTALDESGKPIGPEHVLAMLRSDDPDVQSRLRYTAFSVPRYLGFGVERMESAIAYAREMGVPFVHTRPIRVLDSAHVMVLLNEARERGLEGWVVKRSNVEGWIKIKPTETSDMVVVGWSRGKFNIVLHARRADGIETRVSWTGVRSCEPDELVGMKVEVAHEGVTSGNRLRFPRFVRVREDLGRASGGEA